MGWLKESTFHFGLFTSVGTTKGQRIARTRTAGFFQADAPSRIPTCAESKQHAARGFKSEFIKGSSIVCLYMDQTLFMGGSVRYESKMN